MHVSVCACARVNFISGLRCEASVNYAVVYPTTDDDAPVSVDLFLTAMYDVQAEVILNIKSGLTDQPGTIL